MFDIHFQKPIILRKSLEDMKACDYKLAIRLLEGKAYLTVEEDGVDIADLNKNTKLPPVYFTGSEAVSILRQLLRLPDRSIRSIKVNEIIQEIDDYDTIYDILFFLCSVNNRNERVAKLREMGAPFIIMINEERMLQEYVEFLQDNNWCGHPKKNKFTVESGSGCEECETHEIVRKSLADIDYCLYPMPGIPITDPEDEE